MAAKKISAKIVLDGAAEFNKNVKACDTAIKAFKSELNLISTQYKTSANSLEALQKKQESYSKIQEEQSKKVKVLKSALEDVQKAYDKETEKLEKANKAREKAQKDLDEAKKKYGENSKEVKELEKVLDDCNKAYNDQSEKVQKAGNTVNEFARKVDTSEKELEDTNQALQENNKYLDEAEKSYDSTAKSIDEYGKEIKDAQEETKKFNIEIVNAEESAKNMGQSMGSLISADLIARGIGTVAKSIAHLSTAATKAAIEVGSNFEAQMSKVQAISGATGKDLAALTAIAEKMGASTKFTATEAGEGLEYMAMAGWDAQSSVKALPAVLNLAAAAGADLGTTSDIVTDAMTAFGLKADEAAHFSDVLAATATSANTNVTLMGETFQYVAPIAGAMGYSIEDMSISIGLMANAGIKASQAGTDLRSIITRLSTDAGASSKKLGALGTLTKELGVQFYNTDGSARNLNDVIVESRAAWQGLTEEQQINYAKTIAGQRAMSSWLALMNAADEDIAKVTNAITDCDGAAQSMADTMNNNLKGKITIMNSALESLGISFYRKFEEPLKKAVDTGTEGIDRLNSSLKNGELGESVDRLADSFGDLTEDLLEFAEDALPDVIDGITWVIDNSGQLAAVIGGAATAFGIYETATIAATIATEGLTVALNLNPIGLVAGAVAGLTVALSGLAKAYGEAEYEAKAYYEADKSAEKLEKNKKAWETNKTKIQENAKAASELKDELKNLISQQELSSAEQAKAYSIVSQLNSIIPELGLAYDAATNSINIANEALDLNIDYMLKQAETAAVQERLNANAEEQLEINTKLKDVMSELNDSLVGTGLSLEDLARMFTGVEAETTEFGNAILMDNVALQEQIGHISELWIAQNEYNQQLVDLQFENSELANTITNSTAAMDESSAAMAQYAGETENVGISAEEAARRLEEFGEVVSDAYAEMYESVQNSIESSMSLFDEFKAADKVNADEMLKNVESQIQGYRDWGDSFDELASRTDSKHQEILGYLADLGVEGKGYIDALVNMNDVDFSSAMDKIQEALTIPSEVSAQITDSWLAAGENAVAGAAEGMGKTDEIVDAAKTAGEEATDALTEALDEHSPSKTWEEAGENAVAGLVEGMKDTTKVENASTQIGKAANDAIDKAITKDKFVSIGRRIPEGLAQGIKDGQSQVITAATETAQAAIKAAQDTLQIHSPSRVFAEMGEQTTQGFVEGWNSGSGEIKENVDATMNDLSNTSVDMSSVFMDLFKIPDGFSGEISAQWADTGKNITSGVKQGITETQDIVTTTLTDMAKAALQTITTEWEIAPTSKKFRDHGENAIKGLTEGIKNQKSSVTNIVTTIARETVTTLRTQMSKDKFVTIGQSVPEGLAEGIRSGKSGVVNAAVEVANAAAEAARATLQINSPSKVFAEIGRYSGEGFVVGINSISGDMIAAVNETMGEVAKAGASTFNTGANFGTENNGNFPTSGIGEINQEINIYSNEGGIIETARKFKESMMEAALAW